MSNLQLFLEIDKNNPLFSIYSSENNPELLEVYFGMALLEKLAAWAKHGTNRTDRK